ncbi:MAG: nickel-dependent hydrogenase large subunit, partial [Thermoplasmata archaeon]
ICGRTTHPQRLIPGGFSKIPSKEELKSLKERLQSAVPEIKTLAEFIKTLKENIPDFVRETEYIALVHPEEYALYDGDIGSTLCEPTPVSNYRSWTNEYVVPHSTAKYTKHLKESYMAGALARFNINYNKLSPEAKEIAEMFGLKPICYNPYMNTIAQLVEAMDSLIVSVRIIDELLNDPEYKYTPPTYTIKPGTGAGSVEVPRGILFHEYSFDENGRCTMANLIIPTNQNHANIQLDMEALVPKLIEAGKDEKQIELALEMLVRAYDPCISCSTHYLQVEFV